LQSEGDALQALEKFLREKGGWLPRGWEARMHERSAGDAKQGERYYTFNSPEGRSFRSKIEVARALRLVGGSASRGGSGAATCSAAAAGASESEGDEKCEVCGSGRSRPGNEILLCDGRGRDGRGCDCACHMRCLEPPILMVPSLA
jgi:hypothetical protein